MCVSVISAKSKHEINIGYHFTVVIVKHGLGMEPQEKDTPQVPHLPVNCGVQVQAELFVPLKTSAPMLIIL